MTIRPIRNETDYDAALAEIDHLMGVDPDTPESDRCSSRWVVGEVS